MANASLVLFAGCQAGRLFSTRLFNPAQVLVCLEVRGGRGGTFELQDSGHLFSEVVKANEVRSAWLPSKDAASNFSSLINNPAFENQERRRECVKFNCGYLGSLLLFYAEYLRREG